MSLVLAPLDNLANDSNLSEKSRGFLDMAHRNGNKLLKMVTELLDFQKAEQSAEQVRLQDIELPMLLRVQLESLYWQLRRSIFNCVLKRVRSNRFILMSK